MIAAALIWSTIAVYDDDTIRVDGSAMRLAAIETPEIYPGQFKCAAEGSAPVGGKIEQRRGKPAIRKKQSAFRPSEALWCFADLVIL